MANITNEHEALVRRILAGDGRAFHAQRRAAFDNAGLTGPLRTLTEKVAAKPGVRSARTVSATCVSGDWKHDANIRVVCARRWRARPVQR
jgi:hypothetical protein